MPPYADNFNHQRERDRERDAFPWPLLNVTFDGQKNWSKSRFNVS